MNGVDFEIKKWQTWWQGLGSATWGGCGREGGPLLLAAPPRPTPLALGGRDELGTKQRRAWASVRRDASLVSRAPACSELLGDRDPPLLPPGFGRPVGSRSS